jgi:mannosyl-oligosaccharide alpha-1,2-mannosidase
MVRRKIRPLGIVAVIAVFLLYQFVRRGGREVFTFGSLPPYTDTEHYVKKPTPEAHVVPDPPPPPPEWGRTNPQQHDRTPDRPIPDSQPIHQEPPQLRPHPNIEDSSPRNGNANRPQIPIEPEAERPVFAAGDAANPENPHHHDEIPLSSGHHHNAFDQPPTGGDFQPGGHDRPVFTPQELAPRIERYPVPPNQLIHLPASPAINLPRIQARFSAESTDRRRERLQRQAAIKRAMTRSWEAYSTYAMGHDEVRPVSGRYLDPFCGWGATLVDSLDTLQIMGMDDEYREALEYVAQVDFAHTRSYNIPVFETVIRYLGGLIGAYDMSDGEDTMLLEKARDLGDMLMGAFDTPNRMPLLRYDWRPQAGRQNRRASEDSCLAEMGTLTLEFTRLAQLTGNHSYFDAVCLPILEKII